VRVHYDGDGNFLTGDSNTITQSVKGNVSVAVVSDDNSTIYGDLVTFTVTVNAVGPAVGTPGGTVDFIVDGAIVGNNVALGAVARGSAQANFQTASISAAGSPHSVVVHYDGDTFFFDGDSPAISQTVAKADTVTNVLASPSASVFGQPVTITATVSRQTAGFGTPDGTVDFFIDGSLVQQDVTLDAGGQASIQISDLSVSGSPHTVAVHYDGSGNFNASDVTLADAQTVSQANTTTTVTSSHN